MTWHRPDAQLNSFISGGVEIPHLGLNLRLRYKDNPKSKNDQYLKLAIIWTAWDGSDISRREITTTPERASRPATEDHAFSARLRQVSLTPISLTEAQPALAKKMPAQMDIRLAGHSSLSPTSMGLMQQSHRGYGSKWDNIRYHLNLHIGEAEYTAIVDGGLVDPDRGLGGGGGGDFFCKIFFE